MATVARVKKDGTLLLKDTLNERLPVITDGLVAHYPLDSQAGAVDVVYGRGTNQNLESGINLVDVVGNNQTYTGSWSNPANWTPQVFTWDSAENSLKYTGGSNQSDYLPYIAVDTSKNWYIECDIKSAAGVYGYFGVRFYDASFTEIGVGSHYGTFDYTGFSGWGVPTTWTHVRNNAISGAAKTGEGTSGTTVFHTGTKYIRLFFLLCYGGTDTWWIKNLKFSTTNANTSNCNIVESSVSIEPPYTNLFSNPFLSTDSSGWNEYDNPGKVSGFTRVPIYDCPDPRCQFAMTGVVTGVSSAQGCGTWLTAGSHTANTTYIKFVWVKTSGVDVYCDASYSNIGYSGGTGSVLLKANTWTRIWAFHNSASTVSDGLHIGFYSQSGSIFTFWVTGGLWAVADQAVSTWSGAHSQANLFLPVLPILNNTTCTINFDYFKEYGVSNTLISGSTTQNSPPNGAWWGLYHGNGEVATHWLDGSSTWPGHTQTQDTWSNYTICWDASYEYVYIDGVLKAQKAKSANLATNQLPTITLGWGWTAGNGRFKNFKIYNRTLSVSEIQKLAGEGFKLETAKTISPSYIEAPTIPIDAFYFPLATDTKDSSKAINSVVSTNTTYEDGALWAGTATTNVVTNTNLDTGWEKGYNTGIIWGSASPNYVSSPVVSFYDADTDKYGYWYSYGDYAPQDPSTTYTVSLSAKTNDSNFNINFYTADNAELGRYSSARIVVPGKKVWKRVIWPSFTSSSDAQSDSLSFNYGFGNAQGETQRTWLCAPQMEAKPFASPFVVGSRGATQVSYCFYSSLGLDWSGNWTICYWKKPVGTGNNLFTGYSIEAIGYDSGGYAYMWFGKQSSSDTLVYASNLAGSATIGAITPATYFNNWHIVCIRKNGTTTTFNFRGVDFDYQTNITQTVPSAGYYENSGRGKDFSLGWYEGAYANNAYYRDLMVIKRALSDAELNNIYKQFRITKQSSNSMGLIEEGI